MKDSEFIFDNYVEEPYNKRCCINCARYDTELCGLTDEEKYGIDISNYKCEIFTWI